MAFEIPDSALLRKINKKAVPVVSDFPKTLRKFNNNEKVQRFDDFKKTLGKVKEINRPENLYGRNKSPIKPGHYSEVLNKDAPIKLKPRKT